MRAAIALFGLVMAFAAHAHELTLATWNVAWLRSAPLSDRDYDACRAIARDLRELIDERHPKRWICRNAEHYARLAAIAARVDADIFALQEVESAEAMERLFPRDRYAVHVTGGPWIQRVGFAVRRDRVQVIDFQDYEVIGRPLGERARFAADLTVRLANGRNLRLLGVHLKSACHSRPLNDETPGMRDRPGERPSCLILADQVKPLEDWIDARAQDGVDFVVLGDFNRRFDAPVERERPARDRAGRPLTMWKEIDDGEPPGARLVRITAGREQARSCRTSNRAVEPEERAMFIDHIVVSQSLAGRIVADSARHWPLIEGRITREVRPLLRALSDHCPLSVRLREE